MPILARGNLDEVYVPTNSSLTITPGSGGFVRVGFSVLQGMAPVPPRDVRSEATISVSGGTTLFLEAVGADATYTSPVSGDGSRRLPTFLPFGCSIAEQCNPYLHSEVALITAIARAGQSTIVTSSGGSFASGNRIAHLRYNARLVTNTVNSVSGNNVTMTEPLAVMARASTGIAIIPGTQEWPQINQGYGIINSALALLGNPVQVLPSYGFGGARYVQMIQDLERDLRFFRPDFVGLHMFDNDLTGLVSGGAASLDQLKAFARYMCRLCLDYGATPIVYSQLPYYRASGPVGVSAARAADYDALAAYIGYDQGGQLSADVPGAYGDNSVSFGWLDTSNPTWPRAPLAGWTDGVHPNVDKRFSAGRFALPLLRKIIGRRESHAEQFVSPLEASQLAGTTGTVTGMQAGSVAPASYTVTAFGAVTATTTKNPDGSLRLVADWLGAASRDNDYLWIRYAMTPLDVWAGINRFFQGIFRFRLTRNIGLSRMYCEVSFNTGERFTSLLSSTTYVPDLQTSSESMVMQTPGFRIPAAATTMTIAIQIRPADAASPSGAGCTMDLIELGIVPAAPEPPTAFL